MKTKLKDAIYNLLNDLCLDQARSLGFAAPCVRGHTVDIAIEDIKHHCKSILKTHKKMKSSCYYSSSGRLNVFAYKHDDIGWSIELYFDLD